MLSGLRRSLESPPVADNVRLKIGDNGGVAATRVGVRARRSFCCCHKLSEEVLHDESFCSFDEEEQEEQQMPPQRVHLDVVKQDCEIAAAIAKILKQLKNPAIVRKFYCELPKYLNFDGKGRKRPSSNSLRTVDDEVHESLDDLRVVILVSELLTRLSEEDDLMESVFVCLTDAVPLMLNLLRAATEPCQDEDFKSIQDAVLFHVVLMLCQLLCGVGQGNHFTSSDWESLQCLIPVLRHLKKCCLEPAVCEFAQQLEHTILTHGAVIPWNENKAKEAKEKLYNARKSQKAFDKRPLIQEVPAKINLSHKNAKTNKSKGGKNIPLVKYLDIDDDDDDDTEEEDSEEEITMNIGGKTNSVYNPNVAEEESSNSSIQTPSPRMSCNLKSSTHKLDYDTAMEEVLSPLVPICGHALISLTKLLDANDKKTLQNKTKVLAIFEHHLKHEDSYVYLSAAEGLSALCDAFPDKVSRFSAFTLVLRFLYCISTLRKSILFQ